MPFGTGERICIGNHFALLESQILLSMIIQNFDLQLLNTDEAEIEMAVTVNADSKLIQFLKYCRFKIDTPLSKLSRNRHRCWDIFNFDHTCRTLML